MTRDEKLSQLKTLLTPEACQLLKSVIVSADVQGDYQTRSDDEGSIWCDDTQDTLDALAQEVGSLVPEPQGMTIAKVLRNHHDSFLNDGATDNPGAWPDLYLDAAAEIERLIHFANCFVRQWGATWVDADSDEISKEWALLCGEAQEVVAHANRVYV